MKNRFYAALGGVVLMAAIAVLMKNMDDSAQDNLNKGVDIDKESLSPRYQKSEFKEEHKQDRVEIKKLSKKQETATIEEILGEIHELSITYDPKELPKIAVYLQHPEKEVRKAAVDGMIVLGDSSAGEFLRQAAKMAPTPQDAVLMEETATYLELPSAADVLLKRKSRGGDHD